ncbi:nitroreductase/dihydropteridine reductase [Tenacibaculum lutimaris]|uniref:Nitroreductase/dihydropteridine reductase n=1 Tax=Tenacibaculum lutimaris TaxID=285258 RepID=A0A420E3X1_9FLAO|nr:NAD(P)H-dependent oxidoreductase [Tenacibaculum lutimaris]RKF04788.1 nitroreductase/dihydropteridine reductase [Tenacibaculum lutimaris]
MKPSELAKKRYATKKYDSSKKIPQEKIEELKEVLHLAPSSINIQPWKFTFVQNPAIKSKLADASLHNTEKVNQADLLIVFSVAEDLDAFQKVVDKELPTALGDWYNSIKANIPENDLRVWLAKQVYIALGVAMSTSIALGLDSTPMEGIEPEKYMDILGMSAYKPLFALSVGYRAKDDRYQPEVMPKSRRPYKDVIEVVN